MSLPRVSVVTPSYNQRQFLAETLRSVLAQRAQIHEYFVLDGGSSDGSRELIESYAKDLDFWTSGRDGGQGAAIDRGFRMATGDVVYWLNSDDVMMPEAIAKVRSAFSVSPRLEVVTGWDYLIDQDSRVLRARRPPRQTLAAARWGVVHVSQPTCFMRREAYLGAGGLDTSLGCVLDTELWARLLKRSHTWGHVPDFVAAFRTHPGQKGLAWADQYAREQQALVERHPDIFGADFKHLIGKWMFRGKETVRGRYLLDLVSSWRLRGTPVLEVSRKVKG